jgi:hypothetical protein
MARENLKLLKKNVAIWFNKICKNRHLKPKYINIKLNGNKKVHLLVIYKYNIKMHGMKVKIKKKTEEFTSVFPTLHQSVVPDNANTVNEPGYASQFSDSIGHIRGSISGKCEGFFHHELQSVWGTKFQTLLMLDYLLREK